jgi:hypothetical protein
MATVTGRTRAVTDASGDKRYEDTRNIRNIQAEELVPQVQS